MLYWTIVFFVLAMGAAVLGFSGIVSINSYTESLKVLFIVFMILGCLSLIFGRLSPRRE